MADPLETVRLAWGEEPPDWVLALARACEQSSQARVARALDRSGAVVSQVLRRAYPASTDRIEERVRGLYMNGRVECPGLGEIPSHECQDWRAKAAAFVVSTSLRARMFRACNACPRHTGAGHE